MTHDERNDLDTWDILLRGLHNDLLTKPMKGWVGDIVNPEEKQWSPRVDIKEEPTQFVITADLPGIHEKNLEVFLENNTLSIKGNRNLERNVKKDTYTRVERFSGSFYRQFTLPPHINSEQIKASCKHGVLEIVIPKKDRHTPKKIKILNDEN
jgi:HSP20 family protein